ncbi:MAG TPA: parallel beta-helix domain-containing protein [Chryseolinea sp.]|nr:parallel beta-helix domain-containing protein [Chryseolinea sp.]HPH47017.1 parallel beta-helix domain-containing protein [Chryseolinea sp.]HPM32264.1 parallel beta-helix domain-containing protein [Chryseolinea sp.]
MKIFKRVLLTVVILAAGIYCGKLIFGRGSDIPAPMPTYFSQSTEPGDSVGIGAGTITGKIIEVKKGNSIQEAVGKASPGDLIRIYPGVYNETVYIDKDNISIQGVIENDEWPILDGQKKMNDAILYSGNGVLIENMKITNYKGNAIMGQAGNNYVIRNNWIVDTGVYGIFPQFGKNGVVERNILTGIEDAAIYIGMCDNVDVRFNEVYGNVAGIEIENSRHALVEFNYTHDNTGGILAFLTQGLPIKTCYDVIIRNNYVYNNNTKNFGAVGSTVSHIPAGTGILIMAADDITVENNIISGNDNAGITITDYAFAGVDHANDPESEPNSDRITLLDNFMSNNGNNPIADVKALMATQFSKLGPDIIAVGGGIGSCVINPSRYRTFGLNSYANCQVRDTRSIKTYLLDKPVMPRVTAQIEKGKMTYYGVCSGCHAFSTRLVGPPVNVIQALYKNNPQGIVDFIAHPIHKRDDYPEMPPQNYLTEETRKAVAEYMLSITK